MVKSSGLNFMPLPSDAWHLLGISLALLLFLGWASWALLGIRVQDPARRQSHRVVLVSLSLFAAFLFPTLGVIPIQYNYSTRFLYLPLLFFVIALGGTLDLFFARDPTGKPSPRHPSSVLALVCLALLLGGAVKTFRDTLRWKDDVTLFSFMTSRCPQVPVAFTCLGIGYRHRAEKEARGTPAVLADWLNAARYSEEARRIWPQFGDAYLMEGGALRMAAQCDPLHADSLLTAAIRAYIAGAQEIPDNPLLPMYAGDTYFGAGNLNAAEKAYQEALRRDPTNSDAQERLRVVAKMKGPSLK
jgi:tetratricopeptide (TPR) repeat protein